jgi:hypothetical protein
MLSGQTTPRPLVDLTNHTEVTQALIDTSKHLISKKDQKNILAGFYLLNKLVDEKKCYKEAEEACLNVLNKKSAIKIAILDLLEKLNNNNQATETALILASQFFIHQSSTDLNNVKSHAIHRLHDLIVFKNIDSIPQESILAATLGCSNDDKDIQITSNNIMKVILHKWQFPPIAASGNNKSDELDRSLGSSDLEESLEKCEFKYTLIEEQLFSSESDCDEIEKV